MAETLPVVPESLQPYLKPMQPAAGGAPQIAVDPQAPPLQKLMQGMNQGGVVVSTMDGRKGFVHGSVLDDFLKKNPDWKRSVIMTAPDGNPVAVRPEVANDVLKQGYQIGTPLPKNMTPEGNVLLDTADIGGGFQVPRFEQPSTAEKLIPPLGIFKGLRNVRKAASIVAANARAEGQDPNAAPIVKNVIGPAGEASAEFLGSQFEPANLATLGAMKYLPTSTATLRTLQRGAGAYFTANMGSQAIKSGTGAYKAASEGNIPEAVRQGTEAALTGGMAAEGAYRTGQGAKSAVTDLARVPREAIQSRPSQAIIRSRPVQAITKTAVAAGKASGIGLTPQEMITKAGGPSVYERGFDQALAAAAPRIAEQNQLTPITTVKGMAEGVNAAAGRVWREGYQPQIARHQNATIDGTQIADKIRSGVDEGMKDLFPQQADQATAFASKFDGEITLPKAAAYLKTLNAELKSYYRMSPEQQAAAGITSGRISSYEDAASGLREAIDNRLSDLGEVDSAGLRREYGALKQVQRVFDKRAIVASRQSPLNIQQVLALAGGAGESAGALLTGHPVAALAGAIPIAVTTGLRYANSPDVLVRRGVKGLTNAARPLPTGPILNPVAGFLPPAPILSGPSPEPQYIPPVPPPFDRSTRAQRLGLILNAAPTELGPSNVPEPPMAQPAAKRTVRDARTGKMRRQYLTSSERGTR